MSREKVALITGASRGIGRGIAASLAHYGWQIVINYKENRQAADETQAAVEALGVAGVLVQGDVADLEHHERLLAAALDRFGRLDLLVNNAGMGPRRRMDMLDVPVESYDEVMATNLRGPFFLTQRASKAMIALIQAGKVERPKIVNIGSISAYTSSPQRAEYCVSKAGLGMMTRLWADRLAEFGINVYEVRPGIIQTDLTAVAKEKYDRLILQEGLTPIRRWGQPEDVARAVTAIAEDWLPFSTGEIINVDGGFHLKRL
jgi:NAD(P)-dependent dehydrogenase (short-subunit alcohol dehydrogenase family)